MANSPTATAVGPMAAVAIDQYETRPITHDEMANRILPPGVRAVVALTRWRPVRRWMISASEKQIPGIWASMLCRKRYIEENLLDVIATGIDAVVVLGAGLDTCAYRLPGLAGLPVYEVDLPANIERKRATLERLFGEVPGSVTLVPVDFETQDLGDALAEHGCANDQRIFFAWEGVTQYLTENGVRATFEVLARARPGSRVVFTYVRQDFLEGKNFYGGEVAFRRFVVKRRLWHFGLVPERVPEFLAGYGWNVVEDVGPREFTARYLEPGGRTLPVSEVERSVCAEKS
jgi:methyltransferase (TIGR00027 family)